MFFNTKICNMVVAIEKSKDIEMMRKKVLQISLEAHEQRVEERNKDKAKTEITLQDRFNEKDMRSKGKCLMKKREFLEFWGKRVPKLQEFDLSNGREQLQQKWWSGQL